MSVLTRSESSIASQAKGTDVIARVRQLSETVGDDPCVQAMSIDLLLERAESAKRQLIEAEGCVKGWVEAEYEQKRAATEKQNVRAAERFYNSRGLPCVNAGG